MIGVSYRTQAAAADGGQFHFIQSVTFSEEIPRCARNDNLKTGQVYQT